MATNAKSDEDKPVTEDDLRKVKEEGEVESSTDETPETETSEKESEETSDEDGKTDDSQDEESEDESQEESDEETSEFVKEFPNIKGDTPEEYAKNLETAYKNSTAEALRLKSLNDEKPEETEEAEVDLSNPVTLYMKQKMDEEISQAYKEFSKQFSQVSDPVEYDKFTREVAVFSSTILNSQKRLAPPSELYSKAAVSLGWEPQTVNSNDKLQQELKDRASSSKTTSATKPKSTSKITDLQVSTAKQMGGWTEGKSDPEIRKELEAAT